MKIPAISFLVSALAAVLLSISTLHAADITGVITLKGTPPPENELTPLEEDPTCGSLHTDKPTTHFYVVDAKGGFADVVVSLDVVGKSTGAQAAPAVLDQNGCIYVPGILAIQTGQKLIVKNSDPCIHNVHSISNGSNADHNDAQMQGGAPLTYTFDKPEDFLKFQCDVHQWMKAWVTVVDSPYFAVSDKSGKFTIKNVPPGKYVITAKHRKLSLAGTAYKGLEQPVEVADKDVAVNFTFEVK
jgi:plastocyanin